MKIKLTKAPDDNKAVVLTISVSVKNPRSGQKLQGIVYMGDGVEFPADIVASGNQKIEPNVENDEISHAMWWGIRGTKSFSFEFEFEVVKSTKVRQGFPISYFHRICCLAQRLRGTNSTKNKTDRPLLAASRSNLVRIYNMM